MGMGMGMGMGMMMMNIMQMLPQIDPLQMGALGLLALFMLWHGKVVNKLIDRALKSFDNITTVLEAMEKRFNILDDKLDNIESDLRSERRIATEVERRAHIREVQNEE